MKEILSYILAGALLLIIVRAWITELKEIKERDRRWTQTKE